MVLDGGRNLTKVLGIALAIVSVHTTDALSQTEPPPRIGFYGGGLLTGESSDLYFRVGVNYSWRLVGPIEAYPALEFFGGDRLGQVKSNLFLRVWPFRRGTNPSFWFVGAGAVWARKTTFYPSLVTGFTTPARIGGVFPFVQFQFFGSGRIRAAEVAAGFSIAHP